MEQPTVPNDLTQLTERLGQLVSAIMKETDPVRYDELGEEIWRVLSERELLSYEQADRPAVSTKLSKGQTRS